MILSLIWIWTLDRDKQPKIQQWTGPIVGWARSIAGIKNSKEEECTLGLSKDSKLRKLVTLSVMTRAAQKSSGSWLSSGSAQARANLARAKMTRANLAR
jgi:hypothetical protein